MNRKGWGLGILLAVLMTLPAMAIEVTMEWDRNNPSDPLNADLAGYRLFQYSQSFIGLGISTTQAAGLVSQGQMTSYNINNPDLTSFTVLNLQNGQDYYFRLTAYDFSGNQSGFNVDAQDQDDEVYFINTPPVAQDDTDQLDEDTSQDIDVLANDSDPEMNPLAISHVTAPSNGQAVINGAKITYTPHPDFNGADSFSYTVADNHGATDTATVNLTVRPVNDAPTAQNQSVNTLSDTPVDITLSATDIDLGDTLTYALVQGPQNGTMSDHTDPDNDMTYTPHTNFIGNDSFTFKANDGAADSNVATVTIVVAPLQGALQLSAAAYTVDEGGGSLTIEVWRTGGAQDAVTVDYKIQNGTALNGQDYTAADGLLSWADGDGANKSFSIAITNDALIENNETINILIENPTGGAILGLPTQAVVTIIDNDVNLPPVADAQNLHGDEDTALNITLTGSDPNSDPIAFIVTKNPAHGTLSGTAPQLLYTPQADFNGADSLEFKVNDGVVDSAVAAKVDITVHPVNDPPVAMAGVGTVNAGGSLNVNLSASDIDGDALTYMIAQFPGNGNLTNHLDGDNVVTYTPHAGFFGKDGFTFKAFDGVAESAVMMVDLTVIGVAVTSIDPVFGASCGETPFVIKGDKFAAGLTVKIAGREAKNVTMVDATTLTGITTGGPLGRHDVVVSVPGLGDGALAQGFSYNVQASVFVAANETKDICISPDSGQIVINIPQAVFEADAQLTVDEPKNLAALGEESSLAKLKATGVGVEIVSDKKLRRGRNMSVTMHYRDMDVSDHVEENLKLARYDEDLKMWIPFMDSKVDGDGNKVTAAIDHLSVFQIMQVTAAETLADAKIFPNPFQPALGHTEVKFSQLPADTKIKIYTTLGELVKELLTDATGQATWNAKNDGGEVVSSGAYYIHVKAKNGDDTLKFVIQR